MIAVCRLLACLFYLFIFGHCDNPLTRLIEEPARGIATTTTTTTTARDAASYSCGFGLVNVMRSMDPVATISLFGAPFKQ